MDVQPHPHMGLQTVSWLIDGQIEHRDSTGGHGLVRPGELNLMTAGWGIAHSEYSVDSPQLRGVQMWVALPEEHRHTTPGFAQYTDLPRVQLPDISAGAAGAEVEVIIGEFAGAVSPAEVFSPLLGLQVRTQAAANLELPLRADFEYGVLALDEPLVVGGTEVPAGAMRYLGWGQDSLQIETSQATIFLIFGGEPLAEDLLMWWNFVGRTHQEIEQARTDWQAGQRFGVVIDDANPPLPAPELPNAKLRPRPNRRD